MVVMVLTTRNHDLKFDVMDQSITENLMFIWHIFAHWAIFLHIPAAVCALVFKQFLSLARNIFHSDHTTQLRKATIDPRLVGADARNYASRWGGSISLTHRFKFLHGHVACLLSCARKPQELIGSIAKVIKVLKTKDPSALVSSSSAPSTKNKRITYIREEGMIKGKLLAEVEDAYIVDRPNSGNPNANYSAPPKAVDNTSLALAKAVRSGGWYTFQSAANVDPITGQRRAGE